MKITYYCCDVTRCVETNEAGRRFSNSRVHVCCAHRRHMTIVRQNKTGDFFFIAKSGLDINRYVFSYNNVYYFVRCNYSAGILHTFAVNTVSVLASVWSLSCPSTRSSRPLATNLWRVFGLASTLAKALASPGARWRLFTSWLTLR